MLTRFQISISGQVQGVGFRPWVYRTALRWPLTGLVRNHPGGVHIEVQGQPHHLAAFNRAIESMEDGPQLARIERIHTTEIPASPQEQTFAIDLSDNSGSPAADVTPDAAMCPDCLTEMRDPDDPRHRYPFINCTNCGPRYTIITSVPYDRPNTTMYPFRMCPRCESQYRNPPDRRFHAQPVACPDCGPNVSLVDNKGRPLADGTEPVIAKARKMLLDGRILAIKGIGGFHLACDATSEEAVKLLRQRKHREHKPFALMAAMEEINRHASICDTARRTLTSPQAPIVLLPKKAGHAIAQSAAPGTNTFGFMLPYAPLHHLLFDEKLRVLVMTSANIADQPLVCDNTEALSSLAAIADAFLMHNRDIFRPLDDSIVHIVEGRPVLLRRARGYVPAPIATALPLPAHLIATGSDLKNTFCLGRDNQLILSEHIGDLENAATLRHYRRSIPHLASLFNIRPQFAVADLHPGYFSTQHALSLGLQVMQVQHHWAHIAGVLAEHAHDGPVIGIAADGTGYGDDGAIWGCECLIASLKSYQRFAHLAYFPLAGADKAAKEAIRPLLALLHAAAISADSLLDMVEPDRSRRKIILNQLRLGVNTAPTSSLGRVFDAAAALLGLGSYNHFEAQLPMALEALADPSIENSYPFRFIDAQPLRLDIGPAFAAMVADITADVPRERIAAQFHNTIAQALTEMCIAARRAGSINVVALSGGVFCNRLLLGRTIKLLKQNGFSVLYNIVVPAGDGGNALGQAAIAAGRLADLQ